VVRPKTYHRVERRHGEFRRVLPLTAEVKEEEIEAKVENGVLMVTVPKTEPISPNGSKSRRNGSWLKDREFVEPGVATTLGCFRFRSSPSSGTAFA
jgi:hypothetical protein